MNSVSTEGSQVRLQVRESQKGPESKKTNEEFQDKTCTTEYIFPEELEMVATLRKRLPILTFYSNKWIVLFLCARNYDLEETELLLKQYFKVIKEFNFDQHIPSISKEEMRQLLDQNVYFSPPDCVDIYGRQIEYFFLHRLKPGCSLLEIISAYLWKVEYAVLKIPLATLRNGAIWVCDMKGFSILRHLNFFPTTRALKSYMSGTFPFRVRKIYLVNTPFFVRGILTMAALFLSPKMTDRIKIVSQKELKNIIPDSNLAQSLGGKLSNTEEVLAKAKQKILEADKEICELWEKRMMEIKESGCALPMPNNGQV